MKAFQFILKRSISPLMLVSTILFFIAITAIFMTELLPRIAAKNSSAQIGETVAIDGLELTVTNPRRDSGTPPLVASPEHTFQIITVAIRNRTSSPVQIIPLLQFHAKDSEGLVYHVTVGPTRGDQLSGPLGPMDTLKEELAFEIPQEAKGVYVLFEPGQTGQRILKIPLN